MISIDDPEHISQNFLNFLQVKKQKQIVESLRHHHDQVSPSVDLFDPQASTKSTVAQMLQHPWAGFFVQALPIQQLYQILCRQDLGESLELVQWVRGQQLARVFDFQLWREGSEGPVLDVSGFFKWLRAWLELGPLFAAYRFAELDEEIIALVLKTVLHIIPADLEKDKEYLEFQKDLMKTPDNRFFYKIQDSWAHESDLLLAFVQQLYQYNVALAGQMLGYGCMSIVGEVEDMAVHWRTARLSDAGYVGHQEALQCLSYRFPEVDRQVAQKINEPLKVSKSGRQSYKNSDLFDVIFDLLRREDVEADDIPWALRIPEGLKQGDGGAAFDVSAQDLGDDQIRHQVALNIAAECEKWVSAVLTETVVQPKVPGQSQILLCDRVFQHLTVHAPDYDLEMKMGLAKTANMFFSFLKTHDFDESHLRLAAQYVKNCVNIALEYRVDQDNSLDNGASQGAEIFKKVGPQWLFQWGWNAILDKRLQICDGLERLFQRTGDDRIRPWIPMTFASGDQAAIALKKLLQANRYGDVQKWLDRAEPAFSTPVFATLRHVLCSVPMWMDVTNQNSFPRHPYAFQHFKDLEKMELFAHDLVYQVLADDL